MSSKDVLETLGFGSGFPRVAPNVIAAFAAELTQALSKNDTLGAANVALNFGVEVGVAMCCEADDWEYRTKDEWESHYGRAWKTIRQKVDHRVSGPYAKGAWIRKSDVSKRL